VGHVLKNWFSSFIMEGFKSFRSLSVARERVHFIVSSISYNQKPQSKIEEGFPVLIKLTNLIIETISYSGM